MFRMQLGIMLTWKVVVVCSFLRSITSLTGVFNKVSRTSHNVPPVRGSKVLLAVCFPQSKHATVTPL